MVAMSYSDAAIFCTPQPVLKLFVKLLRGCCRRTPAVGLILPEVPRVPVLRKPRHQRSDAVVTQ